MMPLGAEDPECIDFNRRPLDGANELNTCFFRLSRYPGLRSKLLVTQPGLSIRKTSHARRREVEKLSCLRGYDAFSRSPAATCPGGSPFPRPCRSHFLSGFDACLGYITALL